MKHENGIIVFAFLALLLFNILFAGVSQQTAKANTQNIIAVQLLNIGGGQTSLTNQTTHTSILSAKLVIPIGAQQDSGCMVLYPYNKPLSTLQSFQVYTSYTNATPRFVVLIDTNGNAMTDVVLLSDYQFLSNYSWQITQGGLRWGWSEASPYLSTYGRTWNDFNYWKGIYGNATVLSVGVALEYWAVKDSNGLDQPLYIDELVLNGVTYTLAPPSNQQQDEFVSDNWLMYRHDIQRTGLSTSPVSNGYLLWKFFVGPSFTPSLADRLRASPTIVDGIVYMGSNNSCFIALNSTTGSQIWQVNVGANVESSAAVVDGVVYVGILWNGYSGYVDALNASTGQVIWQFATNSGIESSPAVINGILYIGSFAGYVNALDSSNGELIWSYLTGGSTFSSPSIVSGTLYIGSCDGNVYALNANNGALIWKSHVGNQVYSSPAVVNDIIYVCSDEGYVSALRASDGQMIWQAYIGSGTDHEDDSPAVANGIVYIGARNGFYAFNATNGQQIWFFASPYTPRQFTGFFYSSPSVAGNVVYCGSVDSYLFALNAFDGSLIWSYRMGGFLFSSPAIANGVVYIGSYDGYIYALGTLSNSMTPPTPTTTPQPTATPTPTAAPTPIEVPQPTATPNATEAPTPNSTPSPISPQSTIEPKTAVEANGNGNANMLILTVITGTEVLAMISLFLVFKKKP